MTLDEARALDAADRLAPFRARFALPEGVIYLDGNSLGPLPHAARAAVAELTERQWGERLIRGWNEGWIDAPTRIGDKIARLIGAAPGEVIACDSTSVNLYKLIVAALRARPGVLLSEAGNFPTDLHIAEGAVAAVPGAALRVVERDPGAELRRSGRQRGSHRQPRHQVVGREQVHRAARPEGAHERAVLVDGGADVDRRRARGAQGDGRLGRGRDLRLRTAHRADDVRRAAGKRLQQTLPRHPPSGDLLPGQ